MSTPLNLDYHYGQQSEQYTFYRIPKALFTSELFKGLSCEAKVLYGLMLDRMSLSQKNAWIDARNRVYIFFTLDDIQACLNCGHSKAVKLLAELDDEKGIGLIERRKQGMGRPTIIYVKNFVTALAATEVKTSEKQKSMDHEEGREPCESGGFEEFAAPETSEKQKSGPFAEVMTSENEKSGLPENRCHDFRKADGNQTDLNQTERNEPHSFFPSAGGHGEDPDPDPFFLWTCLHEDIEYDRLCRERDQRYVDEIVDLIFDVMTSSRDTIRVNGEDRPIRAVRGIFEKLGPEHIEFVLDCMEANTTRITNMKSYLLTCLYNAVFVINHSVQAQVNHDEYGEEADEARRPRDRPPSVHWAGKSYSQYRGAV